MIISKKVINCRKLIEKCNEFKRPLCIGYIDYEKAFDSIEHEAIFKALSSIDINETYITILENIYTGVTTRVHVDNQISEKSTNTKRREPGGPNFPQIIPSNNSGSVFFLTAQLRKKGINIDGEKLTELRFADGVALTAEYMTDMEHQLNTLTGESLKIGLKLYR